MLITFKKLNLSFKHIYTAEMVWSR